MKYKYPAQIRDVFKDNPELKTVPEYDVLSTREMCFVMLVSDPESPHVVVMRDIENGEDDLRRSACKAMGWTTKTGNFTVDGEKVMSRSVDKIEAAIQYYREEAGFEIAESKIAVANCLKYVNNFVNVKMNDEYAVPSDEELKIIKIYSDILKGGIFAKGVQQYKEVAGLLKMENKEVAKAGIEKGKKEEDNEGKQGGTAIPDPNG